MKTIDENEFYDFISEIAGYCSSPLTVASEAEKWIERFGEDDRATEKDSAVHAHWIFSYKELGRGITERTEYCAKCSNCGRVETWEETGKADDPERSKRCTYERMPYCHCGAKMIGGDEDDQD